MGTLGGLLFLFIPSIVISIAWSLGLLLVFDKKMNPLEALTMSNRYTYGSKWGMFWPLAALGLAAAILAGLCSFINLIVSAIVLIAVSPIFFSLQAYFYKKLVLDRDNGKASEIVEE